jgi:serine/threonine protein kinase
MGAVYRATQLSVDRPVAFKILSSEYVGNEQFRKRFGLEAKAMAKLNHPNIVQLYDYGESGGVIWMAQEWVPGQTVEDLLEK